MIPPQYRRYLLPLVLGGLGLFLLVRILFIKPAVLVPEDMEVVVLVLLLGAAMFVAIHMIVRISMSHLRLRSIRQARRQTLAEHRHFLSRLDHELKNPITALRSGLKTLELTQLDERQQRIVGILETETLRLSRLVTDLRKLADLETQPLNLQPVAVAPFVETIVQTERQRFTAGQRTLAHTIRIPHTDAAQGTWVFDEDLLALAIHNLLDNAFKYSRPGDNVRLEVGVDAQENLWMRVVDTGSGIAPDALPHIWDELYRAEQPQKVPGSGIGLALVKAIVERHEGEVEIESEAGQGTAVTIHLGRIPQPIL